MKNNKKTLLFAGISIITFGVIGAFAVASSNKTVTSMTKATTKSFKLDLSQAADENGVISAVNLEAGGYEIPFAEYDASEEKNGPLAIDAGTSKTVFNSGDYVYNTASEGLSGVTKVYVKSNLSSVKILAGYEADELYYFATSDGQFDSGFMFEVPNMNFFKIGGTGSELKVASITFEYSYVGDQCVYGEPSDISSFTTYNGTYTNDTHTAIIGGENGENLTLDDVAYEFAGFEYNGGVAYAKADGSVATVEFTDDHHITIKDVNSSSFLSGDYVKAEPATAISVTFDDVDAPETTESERYEVTVGDSFKVKATTDAIPEEVVLIDVVNHNDDFVGGYAFSDKFDLTDIMGCADDVSVTVDTLNVTKSGDDYSVEYADSPDDDTYYVGSSGNYEAEIKNDKLTFEDEATGLYVEIASNHVVTIIVLDPGDYFMYYGDSLKATFSGQEKAGLLNSNNVFTANAAGLCELYFTNGDLDVTVYIEVVEPTPDPEPDPAPTSKTYTFVDENTDEHTVVVVEGVSVTIDDTYVFEWNETDSDYEYEEDSSVAHISIRKSGATYLDFEDKDQIVFGYASPVCVFDLENGIQIYEE